MLMRLKMVKTNFLSKNLLLLLVQITYFLPFVLTQSIAESKIVHLQNTKHQHDRKCTFKTTENFIGTCECPIINDDFTNFICKCNQSTGVDLQKEVFICSCNQVKSSDNLNNCQCLSPKKKINISCGNKTQNNIKLGILLPYTSHKKAWLPKYYSGLYYASAMFVAVNDINNNKLLSKEYSVDFVWGNTNCETMKTISLAMKMMEAEHVDAIIGGGCDSCLMTAQLAAIKDIPMVSHLCTEEELSDKNKYPTFAKTGLFTNSVSASLQTLLDNFKWKHVGIIYEESLVYKKVYNQFKKTFAGNITATKSIIPPARYYVSEHYELAKSDLNYISKTTRIIICLMDFRVLKEILVAARELQLTDGSYVFLAYDSNRYNAANRQNLPFKWAVVDYHHERKVTDDEQRIFQNFMERSKTLCNALPYVLMLSEDMSNYQKTEDFENRVKEDTISKFNSTIYSGSGSRVSPPHQARDLYDAIMLYATAVNNTINKNEDYHSGKIVMKNMKYKKFKDAIGFDMIVDGNLYASVPLALYHWGLNKSSINACHMNGSSYPQMHAIAHFQLKESTNKTKYYYVPIPNAPMYWLGDTKLENIKDTFQEKIQKPTNKGGAKTATMKVAVSIIAAIIGVILIILIIIFIRRYHSQRPNIHRKISTEDSIDDNQNFEI